MISSIPTSGAKKPNQSGYQDRAKAEMARKLKQDSDRLIARRIGELKTMEMELDDSLAKKVLLQREAAILEGQSRTSVAASSGPTLDVKNLERQKTAKKTENQKKVAVIEREVIVLEQEIAKKKNEENKLTTEDAEIDRDFQTKKQETERTNKDLLGKKKQADDLQKEIQTKRQDMKNKEIHIIGLEQAINKLKAEIQTLQTAQRQAA